MPGLSSGTAVLVFGVFDLLHDGHRSFLNQALLHGKELIVVVTPDNVVERLKGRMPCDGEIVRMNYVRALPGVSQVELGDQQLGVYTVIKKFKPDVVCLGYDQRRLGEDIRKKIDAGELSAFELVFLQAHEPEKYHTSLIRAQSAAQNQQSN